MSRDGSGAVLLVVGTPIGNLGDLTPRAVTSLESADVVACEDTRRTRSLLTASNITGKRLLAVHEHNEAQRADEIVRMLDEGRRVALVTDAGMPSISDPGRRVVVAAAAAGHAVVVVPGPSALVTALVASGLASERFVFEGFLARKGAARRQRIEALVEEGRTAVLYEAPHRVQATIADLRDACGPDRHVALARELTKVHEEVWRGTLDEAAKRLASGDSAPRGEFVIVLGGAPEASPPSDADIERALTERLTAGDDRRAAVAGVASDLDVAKRRVYELALRLGGA